MDLALHGKRVLITGASKGIGAAIANHFLEEKALVRIVARGSEQLLNTETSLQKKYGADRVSSMQCDCTDAEALQKLKKSIENDWQGIDIVIANIGDGRSIPEPLPDSEHWQNTWNTNFESALLTTQTFLPLLQQSKGCLLFISSIAGLEAIGAPVDYSTAKAALFALSKNISRKVAPNVRVNVIAPGNVNFPGGSWDEKIKQDADRVSAIIESTVPMNRFGTVDEIADAAIFLCSDRASFITGSVLVVDGGQTVGVI
ncbi:MAG TPA: SDR family oxidoreductase [Chromatiaceae bacterium]|nr:SDR family oxidoreductase [Chromatiaceae bacterium]